MVECAIFGCGTRGIRDKGIYMERIFSVITNQGEEIETFLKKGETNQFSQSVEKTSQTAFWITDESMVDILSPEKQQSCGIGTIQIGFQLKL